MPIRIPENLPAFDILEREHIFVMPRSRAEHQDIRPLRVLLLNLMPNKIETETQILRLLSNSPLQVDVELLQVEHSSRHTNQSHLSTFYQSFSEVQGEYYDGMIITGAPVEHLPFESVDYWDELCDIMEWSRTHVWSVIHICWAALAGLFYHYGVPKYPLPRKLSGIYAHRAEADDPLLRGFDDEFLMPHSRHSEIRRADVERVSGLKILAWSPLAGASILSGADGRLIFVTGHMEYERDTLKSEYFRDKKKGLPAEIPFNYFPGNNPNCTPSFLWRSHANLMYSNWLNYCVYQRTPYDLRTLDAMAVPGGRGQ